MIRTRFPGILLLIVLVSGGTIGQAAAGPLDGPRPAIRSTDRLLRRLVADGMRSSPTFRALVERLASSDVVVYLRCDADTDSRVAGRLSFVGSGGGRRYVVVRVRPLPTRELYLAVLAHELQHAVEIADAPSIVDAESLAREYERIGYVNQRGESRRVSYDSAAAVETGARVLREVSGRHAAD